MIQVQFTDDLDVASDKTLNAVNIQRQDYMQQKNDVQCAKWNKIPTGSTLNHHWADANIRAAIQNKVTAGTTTTKSYLTGMKAGYDTLVNPRTLDATTTQTVNALAGDNSVKLGLFNSSHTDLVKAYTGYYNNLFYWPDKYRTGDAGGADDQPLDQGILLGSLDNWEPSDGYKTAGHGMKKVGATEERARIQWAKTSLEAAIGKIT
ncbi:hypothetical protein [Pseudoalteromonas umbrosa]|uniref:hypothetical protein n=1 Tax=Pseudoalteromonas umbrosa TaxID=3048489 RepID=UPI0024C456F1|nr:hypothetical protein [Pseudoalteromonas sp. B95]MDK1288628.1 hypothetical protein [Pseudoalteromonas sp. B95]